MIPHQNPFKTLTTHGVKGVISHQHRRCTMLSTMILLVSRTRVPSGCPENRGCPRNKALTCVLPTSLWKGSGLDRTPQLHLLRRLLFAHSDSWRWGAWAPVLGYPTPPGPSPPGPSPVPPCPDPVTSPTFPMGDRGTEDECLHSHPDGVTGPDSWASTTNPPWVRVHP